MSPPPVESRIPPNSKAAETAVLGAILLNDDVVKMVSPILSPEDFYVPSHTDIYRAMISLDEAKRPIDLTTLEAELDAKNLLAQIGGSDYLVQLASQVPTTANAEHYAEIVREKSRFRRVIKASLDVASTGYGVMEDEFDYFDYAGNLMYQALQEDRTSILTTIGEELEIFFKRLDQLQNNPHLMSGFGTGYDDVDKMLGGLKGGDLIILAARPSMGKTSFALNIAENVSAMGVPTLVFSLEMNKEQLTKRLIASAGNIDLHKMKNIISNNRIDHDLLKHMLRGADKLSKCPLAMDDTPGISISVVRARARQWRSNKQFFPQGEDSPGLIVIDYLQLMHGKSSREGSREQEVSNISRGLKALAREVNVPVIVLSQLNRKVDENPDHIPMLSNLRESGSIEQDADIILFLHRPEYYDRNNEELKGVAQAIIAKHRNGPTGTVNLRFIHQFTRFENAGGIYDNQEPQYEHGPVDAPF